MLRIIHHHQINKEKWDQSIANAALPYPYLNSWYLDIVCPEWDAIVLDEYLAVSPLAHRTKAGVKYVFQPFFTQQFGLFGKTESFTEACQTEYYKLLTSYSTFIQYQINMAHTVLPTAPFQVKLRHTHHLNLNASYDTIQKKYSENLKRNLKKFKSQLEVKKSTDSGALIHLFKSEKGKEVNELRRSDYDSLQKLITTAVQANHGAVWEVHANHQCVAAAFILYNRSFAVNIINISNTAGRKMQAMSVLLDHVIQTHSETTQTFDFEGSDLPGVAAFYRSFGASSTPYWHISLNQLPWHYRTLKKIKDGLQFRR